MSNYVELLLTDDEILDTKKMLLHGGSFRITFEPTDQVITIVELIKSLQEAFDLPIKTSISIDHEEFKIAIRAKGKRPICSRIARQEGVLNFEK